MGSGRKSLSKKGMPTVAVSQLLCDVWSAPPLQVNTESMAEAVCVTVSGLLVEPQLLALMEYARTGPYNGGGHNGPVTQPG